MSDFRIPELGEGVYEAEFVSWLVKLGQTVKRGQPLMEVLTDKATMEVPSPFAGTIVSLNAEPGQKVKVGEVILTYTAVGETAPIAVKGREESNTKPPAKEAKAPANRKNGNSTVLQTASSAMPIKAAPSVRQMARKLGIDLTRIGGSGPQGRILIGDLSAFIQTKEPAGAKRETEPAPDYGKPGTRIKLVGLRRKIAEHMTEAKRTIPHYAYVDECDVTDLVKLRESLKETFGQAGVKLTYLAFFLKAVVAALKEVPLVNATLDEKAGEIVLHDRYHIGIATATPSGLIVPVVHDADKKDLAQVAREIERLSIEARSGKAKLEDLRGGTFTVTSIGNIGGLFSTPIINLPEVGILGLGKILKRPVYDASGNLRPADMIYLSFSFDHRVLDGAVGAAFGNAVIKRLRNPATLLISDSLAPV
jgi:pyruvate dehydrogenase E2 component (dihydrolipoamide acetyltransferase)/2-oxoisovalerate dehydrogenase E2 component (dihydrolipoyl transacylase)